MHVCLIYDKTVIYTFSIKKMYSCMPCIVVYWWHFYQNFYIYVSIQLLLYTDIWKCIIYIDVSYYWYFMLRKVYSISTISSITYTV